MSMTVFITTAAKNTAVITVKFNKFETFSPYFINITEEKKFLLNIVYGQNMSNFSFSKSMNFLNKKVGSDSFDDPPGLNKGGGV